MKRIVFAIIIYLGNSLLLAKTEASIFDTPPSLVKRVQHWENVYGAYDSNEVIFYDEDSLVVYDKLVLPKVPKELSSSKYRKDVESRRGQIFNVLNLLAKQQEPTLLQKELYEQIKKRLDDKKIKSYEALPDQLKWQNGLKSQFAMGLKESGKYIHEVENIIVKNGFPKEIALLPFVESFYFLGTESSKSAVGIWGLLKETARINGIHVNNFVEERRDPILATNASMNYLKKAMSYLKEWPLTITSFNCGLPGMIRASQNLNSTDLEVIIKEHDSPIFGYASKNYYATFLAALHVYQRQQELFPNLVQEKPWTYDFVQVNKPVLVPDLIKAGAIAKDEIRVLNPSFTKRTLEGLEVIPAQYTLRVPKGSLPTFNKAIKTIPMKKRLNDGIKISHKYRADGRNTLAQIAKDLGIAVDFLTNGLKQGPRYKPKGLINIRSQAHQFSQVRPLVEEVQILTTNNN